MQLSPLNIVKNLCWVSLSQISQKQHKHIKYATCISILLSLNTRKIAFKNGGWVAATQNQFSWTTSVHGGFKTMSTGKKKSLFVCLVWSANDSRSGLQRNTLALSSYVFLQTLEWGEVVSSPTQIPEGRAAGKGAGMETTRTMLA